MRLHDTGSLRVGTNGDDLRLHDFGERLAAIGGRAVVLESLVKASRESGFQGTEQQAADTLRGSGRFSIAQGPSGRLIVWRTPG